MELDGELKELEMQQKDSETVQGAQWREKKSESENTWVVFKQATPLRF